MVWAKKAHVGFMMQSGASKFQDVDLLRGLAAFAVVLFHFLLGFAHSPQAFEAIPDALLAERPFLLFLVNGPFMVTIFFVLSSFVLTAGLVREADPKRGLIAVAKRFPRLFLLTMVGTLLPALLYGLGLMANEEAAALNGSTWLQRSGGVKVWDAWPQPTILGAFSDTILVFHRGLSQYNSALWTMKYELFGSIFALVSAMIIGSRPKPVIDAAILFVIAVIALRTHPLCAICVTTVYFAKYVLQQPDRLDRSTSILLIVLGFALGCTYMPFPEAWHEDEWVRWQVLRADWLVHGIGATMLCIGIRGLPQLRGNGWWIGRQLGRLSFAIYVLHVPLQASIASLIVLAMGYSWESVLIAFIASTAALFLLAVPVTYLDEQWVKKLNDVFGGRRVGLAARTV
jgi:peptidoglycan/LPS O-acetylase OafA/YrhL